MTDVSNKTLAALVLLALAVVTLSTLMQFSRLGGGNLISGMAVTDTGDVTLTVGSGLAIEVDATNNTIAFGTCSPNGTDAVISSFNAQSDTAVCNGAAATGLDNIQINNVGNTDANITVEGECAPRLFIPDLVGGDGNFEIQTTGTACASGNVTWVTLSTLGQQACTNLTTGGQMYLWARVTIPSDADQTQLCSNGTAATTNRLRFNATASIYT